MSSLSSAFQCKDLRSDPQPVPPLSSNLASQPQADNQPQRMVSALKSLGVPYLAASPQSPDKVLFSQLTGGWCWTPLTPPLTAVLAWMQKVIPEVCHPTWRQFPSQRRGPYIVIMPCLLLYCSCLPDQTHFVLMLSPCFICQSLLSVFPGGHSLSLSPFKHNSLAVSTWTPPPITYQTTMLMHSPFFFQFHFIVALCKLRHSCLKQHKHQPP